MKNTIEINNIDFKLLKKQKKVFIRMIQVWSESADRNQRKDAKKAEGLLSLIDAIQDYAVDKLGVKERDVF